MNPAAIQPDSKSTIADGLARDSIGLIGTVNCGKTIFIVSISEQTDRRTGRWRFGLGYPEAIAYVQSLRKNPEHGSTLKVEHKTVMLFPAQTRWSIIGHRIPVLGSRLFTQYQISVPDASGEFIQHVAACPDDFHKVLDPSHMGAKEGRFAVDFMEYLTECAGILCCLDPLGWNQDHTETSPASAVSSFNACQVAIGHVLMHRARQLPLPVSVMLTKADELDAAGKGTVRLPAQDCLTLEYFKQRNQAPTWLIIDNGWAQFDVMTALRQAHEELEYGERLAWDFLNCHCPLLAEKLHTWNEDERISARPYLVSSAGMPLERRSGQFLLPKPGAMQPVRTSDPIRSVLDRVHSYRTTRRTARLLTAAVIALGALMVLGPWSVNLISATAAYLVSKGHLGSARALLAAYQYHPVIDLDKARAPQRLANLANANQELAEQLFKTGQPGEHISQILAAANRASFLSPDGQSTAEWRDAMLIDLLGRATKELRIDDGLALIAQSKGLLRPTPTVVDAIGSVLASACTRARHSVTAHPKEVQTLQALESIAADLSSGDLFLPEFTSTETSARRLEAARRMGSTVTASCQASRALAAISTTTTGQLTPTNLAAPGAPLDMLSSAQRIAMESGDSSAIRDVGQVELQIGLFTLDEMSGNGRSWAPDDVQISAMLLQRFPALTSEIATRAEQQVHRLRADARIRIGGVASGTTAQSPEYQAALFAEYAKLRGTDPREGRALDLRLAVEVLRASLSTAGTTPPVQDIKRTIQEIESLSFDSKPLRLPLPNEPLWDVSSEIRSALEQVSLRAEEQLTEAIATGPSVRIAAIADLADCLSQTPLLSEQQREFHRQGKSAADYVSACLGLGSSPTESWPAIRDLLGRQLSGPRTPAAQRALEQGCRRISSSDYPAPLSSLVAFRAGLTSQASLATEWQQSVGGALQALDTVIQNRLLSDEGLRLSPDAGDLLVSSVVAGDGTPTGRVTTLGRWLGFASAQKLPQALGGMTNKVATAFGQTASSPEERSAPFRPLIRNLVVLLREGRVGSISVPTGASAAATAANADSALRALESISHQKSLIEEGSFVFVPSLGCYVGRTEVTIGWCDRVSGEHPGLGITFDSKRRKDLAARIKRPDEELLAFGLSFNDAKRLAEACGARLPTTSEWSQLAVAAEPLRGAGWQTAVDRIGLEAAGDSLAILDGAALAKPLLGLRAGLREWTVDANSHPVLMGGSFFALTPAIANDPAPQADYGMRMVLDPVPADVLKFVQGER